MLPIFTVIFMSGEMADYFRKTILFSFNLEMINVAVKCVTLSSLNVHYSLRGQQDQILLRQLLSGLGIPLSFDLKWAFPIIIDSAML